MQGYLFDGWSTLLRTVTVAVFSYAGVIFFLRISGKRTLSKWNAFDLVATVALGSSLATSILSKDVSLAQGVVAFALLIGLQYLITWLSVRYPSVDNLVKAQPTLLLYRGTILESALRRERVTVSELHAALRSKGITDIHLAGAVVLETDGSFSVIEEIKSEGEASTLENIVKPRRKR